MSEKELIDMYTKELRLSSVRENVQLFAEDAARVKSCRRVSLSKMYSSDIISQSLSQSIELVTSKRAQSLKWDLGPQIVLGGWHRRGFAE